MANPAWQATGTAVDSAGTAITIAWPSHIIGDVALLFVETRGASPTTLATANGFVQLGTEQTTGVAGAGTQLTVFWCRATTNTMASPITAAGLNHLYGRIITYRNCKGSGNPYDVEAGGVKAATSNSATLPAVTTTVANALIVQAITSDVDSTAAFASAQTNTNLTSITERADAGTTQGNGGGLAVWEGRKATAGSTGTTAVSVTNSINAFMTISLVGSPPTVVLNTADAFDFATDTTPTLEFTGTDGSAGDVRYNTQIYSLPIDSYSETNTDTDRGTSFFSGWGQTFTGSGFAIGFAKLWLKKVGSPTGTATAKIYAHTGTYGLDGTPTGAALAVSDAFDVSTLASSYALHAITFSGANQITPSSGTRYVITLEYPPNGTNYIVTGLDSSNPTHSGNSVSLASGTWSASDTFDQPFYIYPIGSPGISIDKTSGSDAGFLNTNDILSDDFDDNSFNSSKWTRTNSTQVVEQNNRLEVSTILAGNYVSLTSISSFNLTNAAAQCQVVEDGNQALASLELYPVSLNNTGATNKLEIAISGNNVLSKKTVASVGTTVNTTAYNASVHKYFRIREKGGTTFWEYSTDGGTWTALTSQANPITVTALFFGIATGTFAAEASTTTVHYDNVYWRNVDPFTSGQKVSYTVQAADALADGTYYWRARGNDPLGTNTYGAWPATRSFTIASTPPSLPKPIRRIQQAVNRGSTY